MNAPDFGKVTQLIGQLKPAVGSQQLIAVHNGYRLWLGLLAYQNNQPQLMGSAASNAIDASVAVAEAKQRLGQQLAARLPRQVTLVSSCALPALLDLPIEADKPRKPAEMESMISWELETQVADNNDQYNLGAILNGRGLIDARQRHQIAVELEARRGKGNSLARYGEVALDLNLIDQQQLQESLQLQEKLVVTDTHLACGWQVQTLKREDSTEHQWLVAGIDTRVRRQWFNAFDASGLRLKEILPLAGSAASWAAMQSELGNVVVVEAGQDNVICYRLERSQFAGLQTQPRQLHRTLPEQCAGVLAELARGDTEKVWVVDTGRGQGPITDTRHMAPVGATAPDDSLWIGDAGGIDALCLDVDSDGVAIDADPDAWTLSQLSQRLQRETDWLLGEDRLRPHGLPDQVLAAFLGAALALHRNVLFDANGNQVRLPRVLPREPSPPLWKNTQVYRYGIPALLVLGMLSHGGYSLWLNDHLQGRLDTLDIEYKKKLELNKKLSSITGEYQKKEEELKQLQQKASEVAGQLSQLNDKIIARTRLVPRLLKTVSLSITNSVMLDSIVEPDRDSRDRFNITAWAMDNPGASEFVERLQQLVGRLGYRVADPDIRVGIGRYGLNGYTVNLWLIPMSSGQEGAPQ